LVVTVGSLSGVEVVVADESVVDAEIEPEMSLDVAAVDDAEAIEVEFIACTFLMIEALLRPPHETPSRA
jgi:hypothetical protein